MTSTSMLPEMFVRLDTAQWEFADAVRGVVAHTDIAHVLDRGWDNQDIAAWQMVEAVLWARAMGATWQSIGDVLYTTGQAVQQKFGGYSLVDVIEGYRKAGVDI